MVSGKNSYFGSFDRYISETTGPRKLKFGIKITILPLLALIKFHPDQPYENGENPVLDRGETLIFLVYGRVFHDFWLQERS